ncbi:DUF4224 domain-containing protein [Alcaligenaceae bacterium B3P038]|nr:DUF4224 domain-containing protein [Alcaligenaceae bacterium B3P038]
MILSEDDLYKLTGFKNAVSQRRVLDAQGIPYKQRGAHNIVMEKHVMAWTEGRRVPRIVELDFSCVR